jgi:hypothetical protein
MIMKGNYISQDKKENESILKMDEHQNFEFVCRKRIKSKTRARKKEEEDLRAKILYWKDKGLTMG